MSTPEEPPQLTRRQLRELRNTAATPIVTDVPRDEPAAAPAAPLPRAAEPVVLEEPATPAPVRDGAPSLTRREVRQRERLRTASVPVITAEVLAATAAEEAERKAWEAAQAEASEEAAPVDEDVVELEVVATERTGGDSADATTTPAAGDGPEAEEPAAEEPATDEATSADAAPSDAEAQTAEGAPSEHEPAAGDEDDRRVIGEGLGSDLLRGQVAEVEIPASFDQLLTRGSTATGALSMPNALILSQTPDGGGFSSPVTATGEVIITGTYALPDHYGSTGTVPGRSEGNDVDAVLIDGELPAASSPTPIAASAAISTIKSADEIIKPPAPEKGSRLMMVLAITAGVLAVALAGVLIVAITTGVFG